MSIHRRFLCSSFKSLNNIVRNANSYRYYSILSCSRLNIVESSDVYRDKVVYTKRNDNNQLLFVGNRHFSKDVKVINVPTLGDSISEGTLTKWAKSVGEFVHVDDVIAVVETDKVTLDVNAPVAGVLVKQYSGAGDTIFVGKPLVEVDTSAKPPEKAPEPKEVPKTEEPESKPLESKPPSKAESAPPKDTTPVPPKQPPQPDLKPLSAFEGAGPLSMGPPKVVPASYLEPETRVPLTRMRMRIAERLKYAQSENVMLTTFNECDMSEITKVRKILNDSGEVSCKLGFVSAFMRASTLALLKMPIMNSYIDGNEMVTKNYVDISVAVATPTGLLVPVIRNCESKNWEDLELSLADMALRAREGRITVEDMTGGTFTISNGGVYGSLMSTPIINPPQSSILGMHAIIKRPVVRDDAIVIRPMMNLALTYDHRLIDGRDAVTFLNTIKKFIENPSLLLLK
ncbi:dihydrolipoamide succinyltransferase [Theileria orientalis]|uniref:Dihydrolipoamide acetyltransferase component of pyruvate dehydrogenase complex n=1 Tax=Theileria orientalis TaxID=68886 RepID=A0A976M3P3_THEOR|nr:dihydrolipoamide succinyltransferase [Theileria orientalis]